MQKQQILGLLVLLLVTVGTIGFSEHLSQREAAEEAAAYEALLAATPVAELEGDGRSPDGRLEVRTVGKSDTYISGLRLPERLEIADTETGTVLWKDMGYPRQSVLWSADSRYLALAYGGRTWGQVKIIETDTWTSWDVTLPDGGPIPEYTFLPEDWGEWQEKTVLGEDYDLILTVGRGGDSGEQHTYHCFFRMEDGILAGNTVEQTTEILTGTWDFDHDGGTETVEAVTFWSDREGGYPAWYQLGICRQDGTLLWMQDGFCLSHAGWGAVAACTVDGQDYLMRYNPTMYLGAAGYGYQIFSLDENGGEVVLTENDVAFDISFGAPHHESFNAAAIADFLWEARGYLAESTVLLSTADGVFRFGVPGLDVLRDSYFGDLSAIDSRAAMVDVVRRVETDWLASQS